MEYKGEAAFAIDLGDKRRKAGLTQEQLAEILERDPKHISAIENRKHAIPLGLAIKAVVAVGPLRVRLDSGEEALVAPVYGRHAVITTDLRPGEAAWVAIEEAQEAAEATPGIQRAILAGDKQELVRLAEQAICDPLHAAGLLQASIEAYDPEVIREAYERHQQKLEKKGLIDVAA